MPTNKPMKNQWIEVDGRLIPATLPQHWSGNDWAITGTDNPLPVANYTKKGNLWLPTSEDNPVPTQLTGSKAEYERVIDAVTIPPNETLPSAEIGNIDIGNESIFFLQILMDQDFEVRPSERFGSAANLYDRNQVFPSKGTIPKTSTTNPYLCVPVGRDLGFGDDIERNIGYIQLLQKKGRRFRVVIDNKSNEEATCTIDIVRVWGAL